MAMLSPKYELVKWSLIKEKAIGKSNICLTFLLNFYKVISNFKSYNKLKLWKDQVIQKKITKQKGNYRNRKLKNAKIMIKNTLKLQKTQKKWWNLA